MSKYLIRPDDHAIFELQEDGSYKHEPIGGLSMCTFSYAKGILLGYEFYPAEDIDLPEIKQKQQLYKDWFNWSSRPDGHGGCKGGTMEEFLTKK